MIATGMLKGLKHEYEEPLNYTLAFKDASLFMNDALNQTVSIQFAGHIECVYCGRKIKKSFNNGACYPCFKNRPENDLCIVKPHECHFEQGTCRDAAWGEQHCMVPHYVYLAVSSDVKVGLTRKGNELKRWGDQGASYAVPVAELPTRKMAGELEVALSEYIADKTNWRKMLKGELPDVSLEQVRQDILKKVPEVFHPFLLREEEVIAIVYPQLEQIDKIKSYNLDKTPCIEDRLIGIKGQYLILENGVINMKKYAGYHISVTVHDS
ncbi:DUF2797 domain-containing protein [Caldalkalibacillus salinus]|uniref:DUF2797 domain-containing protein n=1 Tax=Caldalkalibacillus salinus TaxID=2803787 RepID=UPI0019226FF4|nr:DUF2797 domain-containing protein [Caldalkalibacillus salinus]